MSSCIFRARLNQLWSLWYTTLITLLHVYLIYLGFERYRLFAEMKWPQGQFPRGSLSAYVCLHAACIPLCLLFVASGFFKSANLAGDNERLGARDERVLEQTHDNNQEVTNSRGCGHRAKAIWQHGPPLPQLIHGIIAMLLLFAQQLMLAQLYRFGFINSGDFLNTEMDFLYQRARQLATNLPMGDTRLQGFRITAEQLANSPLAPNLLPVLMHARLFGIPLEFVNFFFALLVFACAYPAVFWRVNKTFTCLFSLQLAIHSMTVIFSYLNFSVLYRIQETNYATIRPVGLGQYLASSRPLMVYHPYAIIATFVATLFFMHLASTALYAYGYNKYLVNMLVTRTRNLTIQANGGPLEHRRHKSPPLPNELCCDGYGPHIAAILLLVIIVVLKAPTIYATMVLYQHEQRALLLSCIVVDIVYLFTWIFLWLILTLKRDWHFRVGYSVQEIIALQGANGIESVRASNNISSRRKTLNELKNALVLMHGEQMYITDDPATKIALIRHAQKYGIGGGGGGGGGGGEEGNWPKSSPPTRKIPLEERGTPEMSRLLNQQNNSNTLARRSSDDSPAAYHTIAPRNQIIQPPPQHQARIVGGTYQRFSDSSPPDDALILNNAYGTLQRGMNANVNNNNPDNTLRRNQQQQQAQASTLQRTNNISSSDYGHYATRPPLPHHAVAETYASIHKSSRSGLLNQATMLENQQQQQQQQQRQQPRRGSFGRRQMGDEQLIDAGDGMMMERGSYANLTGSSQYATYARAVPQGRQVHTVIQPQQQQQSTLLRNESNGYQQYNGQRRTADHSPSPHPNAVASSTLTAMKQSPVLGGDRSFTSRTINTRRETTPASSNNINRPPPSNNVWTNNASYQQVSASSSLQEQLTPTSTLTSHSHVTPTPGSPSTTSAASYAPVTMNGFDNSAMYGNLNGYGSFTAGNGSFTAGNGSSNSAARHTTIKIPPGTQRRMDHDDRDDEEYATSCV